MSPRKQPVGKRSTTHEPHWQDASCPLWGHRGLAVSISLLTVAAFAPVLLNGFVEWDDDRMLTENPRYRGLGWTQLAWMFTTFHMGHYQPLSWVTLGVDYLLWGMNPTGYHLTNLLLHAVSSAVFYLCTRRLLAAAFSLSKQASDWRLCIASAVAALFFALHPLRVESVAWATERRDVLSGLFFFTTIHAYLHAVAHEVSGDRRRWMCLALVSYGLSLLAKATAMTLPLVLLLVDVYPLQRFEPKPRLDSHTRMILREKIPFFAMALLFATLAVAAQQSAGALRPVGLYFVSYRIAQAFYGLCFYLWKTMLPFSLSPIYELPYDFDSSMPLFAACGAAVIAITIALYRLRQRWPFLLACWVYYVVVAAPTLGIAQAGNQLVADRYSYLSCLSWALLFGGAFYALGERRTLLPRPRFVPASYAVAGLVLAMAAVLTWKQARIWRTTETLWTHAIAAAPDASIARYNMAHFLEHNGEPERSIQFYQDALMLNPTYAEAHYNLARLMARQGRHEEAIEHYRRALKIVPADSEALNNLGLLLAVRGNTDESISYLRRATEINPQYGKPFYNLGRVYVGIGNFEEAIRNFEQALKLDPGEPEVHVGIAGAFAGAGRLPEAAHHLQRAVALAPNSADTRIALGRLLARQGRKDEAAVQYEHAQRILQAQAAR